MTTGRMGNISFNKLKVQSAKLRSDYNSKYHNFDLCILNFTLIMKNGHNHFLIGVGRVIKSAIISFWRNRLLSLATTIIIVLALLIISIFSLTVIVVNKASAVIREKVDLTVYLKDADSDDQIEALGDIIRSRPEVTAVSFVSKDEALTRFQAQNSGSSDIANVISEIDNPLPRSFDVKTETPEQIETVANFLNSPDYAPLIEQINYVQTKNIIDRLIKITYFVRLVGWSLSLLFLLISIMIVYNSVRIAIYSRSDEIEIMRLVGATDFYVRGPFVIEGMTYGFVAAILASIIFYFIANFSIAPTQQYLGVSDLSTSISANIGWIILLMFAVGLLMGATCSFFAVRRYLFSNKKK